MMNGLRKFALLIVVVLPFLATLYAIVLLWNRLVNWQDLGLLAAMYILTVLGVTVGYHRLLTHRSFETYPVLRFIFLVLAAMSFQGSAYDWASTHHYHHLHTDTEGDPHSPLEGFIHSHTGWLFNDQSGPHFQSAFAAHLRKDRLVMAMSHTFLLWAVIGLLIPYCLDGWKGLLWGGLVRIFLVHHVTWSVNSVCHTFGKRMFDTPDQSRNNGWVGVLAGGEGWHNNHHAFPQSAFHGLRWWQLDFSAYLIRFMEMLGLAWKVNRISSEKIQQKLVQKKIMRSS